MDFLTGFNIFIIAALALIFPFLDIPSEQQKRVALIAVGLFIVPLIAALVGSPYHWLEVDYMEVILLQRGITSLLFALGYGITLGMLLAKLKALILAMFTKEKHKSELIDG